MSSIGKTTRMLWVVIGLPLTFLVAFSKDWHWLIGVFCAGSLILSFMDPVQRAEMSKPVGMPTVLLCLSIPAVFLTYAAVHTFEQPLLPILGIFAALSLIAFTSFLRIKRRAKRQEILKDL
jgi:hypothetical protein